MERELERERADGLIIGSAGPFYVALNRAAFYLIGVLFLTLAPGVVFLLRDSSPAVRIAVGAGIAMETGTIVHIWLERVRGQEGVFPWAVHFAVSAVVFAAIMLAVTAL